MERLAREHAAALFADLTLGYRRSAIQLERRLLMLLVQLQHCADWT
jgi:hypothetical protein